MSHDDFETMRGLPAGLPLGEAVLWQGSPRWQSLARSAFHVDLVAAYFAVMLGWQLATLLHAGGSASQVAGTFAAPVALAAGALMVLCALAYLSARATIYTITTRRVVVRGGIALTLSLNVPFTQINHAALRVHRDGTGDIPLELVRGVRVDYLVNWPNMRPWRYARPQPMLRSIEEPQVAGRILTDAVAAVVAGVAPAFRAPRSVAAAGEAPNGAVAA
ncbi:MAG: PH domain-containing protein [Proteobacteria bacterium]|nr:PH domain-containing protein [Pseudomonadota bacterium]